MNAPETGGFETQMQALLSRVADEAAERAAARVAERMVEQATAQDRMLTVDEAAEILGVEPRWLYDRSDELPFARKLAPRTLRFSERGLYRWLETRP